MAARLSKNPKSHDSQDPPFAPRGSAAAQKNAHHVTSATVSRYPIGRTLLPSGRFARAYPGDVSAAPKDSRNPLFAWRVRPPWRIRRVYAQGALRADQEGFVGSAGAESVGGS